MSESLALTRLLNQLFGGAVTSLMQLVGVHPSDPAAPITNAYAIELLIAGLLIAFFIFVRLTLSVEKPNPGQQVAEMVYEFTGSLGAQIIGHADEKHLSFVTFMFLFVLARRLA